VAHTMRSPKRRAQTTRHQTHAWRARPCAQFGRQHLPWRGGAAEQRRGRGGTHQPRKPFRHHGIVGTARPYGAVRRLEDIATARRRLNGNGNPVLVFEALFCAL
jgi:DNA polymerase III, delta prime subunit (EC 2.7.7.7)